MNRWALGVEYVGTDYCGWQRQGHCNSVQGQLEKALGQIAHAQIDVHCAGRTDAGVHGFGQVVHFDTDRERPKTAWMQGANTLLPRDIRVVWAQQVDENFHARFSAQARQYRYVIYNRLQPSALLHGRVYWERHPLNEQAMHHAGSALIGEQDFSSFRASQCQARHGRRELQMLSVSRHQDFVHIDIKANAFVHHMVRNIAGTLMQIGRGEKPIEWAGELLAMKDRTKAYATAPAEGLYFIKAFYPQSFSLPQLSLGEVLW
ncbi:tRNA pseudouridine(38-40) synthase TruA [Thiomicrospira sp. ALE5]|uniref:tRNA pseudouridine(38-40) synthase TruA n=1 Tax=Thiomicrospira sp. ALE5 TaxID=748650 RepID=UPI0008F042C4|nr:tRNA pseudouridine(38-40) synthase TruA [Thiomicrospira sp. ALE5]SFR48777.1 tRNA pseudouridine38-40 synthase [Thiomicrospira sp. ALE5]